ncbi:MAG: DUF4124 domain-containing protein [Rhodanobacter sp.]
MAVKMKTSSSRTGLLCTAFLLLAATQAAGAQNIYKCTKGGQLEYTDRPCPGGSGELIHQASDSEVIDQYLDLGQDALAKRYADSHHLQGLYQQRVDAYQQKMDAQAQQRADDEKERADDARQQAQISEAAYRGRLQGENNALRQQNDQFLDQLSQPAYSDSPAYAPIYWGALAPPGNHDHNHDHDHDHDHDHGQHPPPPPKPVPPKMPIAGQMKY